MLIVRTLLVVLLIAVANGCFAMKVSSSHDTSASFSSLKTYAWIPRPKRDPILSRIDDEFVQARVQDAVDSQLAAKGYEKRSSGAPDFLVRYYATLRTKTSVQTEYYDTYRYSGDPSDRYRGGLAEPPRTYAYDSDEASLILDFVHPETQRRIWRGTAQAAVDSSWSQRKKTAKINKAVRRMLKRFPPK